MNQQNVCSPPAKAVFESMVDLLTMALGDDRSQVEITDVEEVIGALRVWYPRCSEFGLLDGMVQMKLGNWADAEFIFGGMVRDGRCTLAGRTMQLRCLREMGSPGWQDEARQLAEDSTSGAAGDVARALLADEALQQAIRTAHRTGVFVAPEPVALLADPAAPGTPAMSALPHGLHDADATDYSLSMHYLRI